MTTKRSPYFFPVLFALISVLFLGILVTVYRLSVKANPVMLDDQGRPTNRS
ncbi:MAG: hypothetical protein LWX11_00065 [Firmicutes bacterium]|nr:hypothetical protein [Bacillota bacterium]